MHSIILAAVFLVCDIHATTVSPRPVSQIPDSGIMVDWQDIELDAANGPLTQAIVQLYTQNGIKWARVRPQWARVESTVGAYNFDGADALINQLYANDTKIWLTLEGSGQGLYAAGNAPTNANGAMTPWLNYVGAVVTRYQGKVSAWEMWNEENLSWLPVIDTAAYASFAQQTATKIRSIAPNAYVVLGGVSLIDTTYLQNVLPATGNSINAIAIHPYRQYPEQAQDQFVANSITLLGGTGIKPNSAFANTGAANYAGEIAKLRNILSNAGFPNLPIWAGECGYPTQNEVKNVWVGTVIQQAKNLARYYVLNMSLGLPKASWWRVFDTQSIVTNELTPPGGAWLDDYRNNAVNSTNFGFATFSPTYAQIGVSIAIPASNFSSQINMAVSGSAIAPISGLGLVTYSTVVPAGDYAVWMHLASTSTTRPALAVCLINNSSYTAINGHQYGYFAENNIPAILQARTDYSGFYYTPCAYASAATPFGFYYPVHISTSGAMSLSFLFQDEGTKADEIRLSPIGALTPKPSGTALQTLASLFDDRVGLADNFSATFSGPAAQSSAFESASFMTEGGVPIVAYWLGQGQAPVDSFSPLSANVTLSESLQDPIIIDPLFGTYASAGSGKMTTLSLTVSDYPLILTSSSALGKTSSQILVEDETYNFPNPVRGSQTSLRYYLSQPSDVKIELFNSSHALIHSDHVSSPAGRNVYTWDVGRVANGVYFWRVTAGGQSVIKKVLVLR